MRRRIASRADFVRTALDPEVRRKDLPCFVRGLSGWTYVMWVLPARVPPRSGHSGWGRDKVVRTPWSLPLGRVRENEGGGLHNIGDDGMVWGTIFLTRLHVEGALATFRTWLQENHPDAYLANL